MRLLSFDVTSKVIGVIDVDRKKDANAPNIKNHKVHMLKDPSFPQAALETPTPTDSGHVATREKTSPGDSLSQPSSNQRAYHVLLEVAYSNECQLKKLAKSLPDMLMDAIEKIIRGLANNVENL